MPSKDKLIEKLFRTPLPKNFTTKDLDQLMSKCGCNKFQGGRGSGIAYYHNKSKQTLKFDQPHPGNELYFYQVKKVREFLQKIGEVE